MLILAITLSGCGGTNSAKALQENPVDFDGIKFDLEFKTRYKGGFKAFRDFVKNQTSCVKELDPEHGEVKLCIYVGSNGKTTDMHLEPAEDFSLDTAISHKCWETFQNIQWNPDTINKKDFNFCIYINSCKGYFCIINPITVLFLSSNFRILYLFFF